MTRIEDYALLGDLQTAALVGIDGSVDWLCMPRFDSPAAFAALLGGPEAGFWRVAPLDDHAQASRRYVPDTLVLETEWTTPTGRAKVIDLMPLRGEAPDVVRVVEGISGRVRMGSELRLRFDYGRIRPWVRTVDGQLTAIAGPDAAWFSTPVPVEPRGWSSVSEFEVGPGERIPFVLTWSPSHLPPPARVDAEAALTETLDFWTGWRAEGREVSGPYAESVGRSLITLKALTYHPTGGIVAAATTSLPEQIGGPRNWDYRYCWLRDATFALQALLAAGYRDEAAAWRDWLLRAVAGNPAELQIMYSIDGTRRLPEMELDWLPGYEGSRPVRIGNAASSQLQLDVWGETLDGLSLARDAGLAPTHDAWDLQVALMEHLEGAWDQPDNGLWEVRGPRQHFTHSKVMSWVAADRMVKALRSHPHLDGPVERWAALRTEIHRDVLDRGFDARRTTFVQAYGSDALDASLLLIPRVGFLPGDDPRVLGTIQAIRSELSDHGLVRRYCTRATDDGLPDGEGLFFACSFWMVDALHLAGRATEATKLFERLLTFRNDVGLLSEEWDVRRHRLVGNFPQAFSHFPLVTSALQLHAGRGHGSHEQIGTSS